LRTYREITKLFGGLNEVKAGLSFPKGVEKPEELILYEQITELGIPVVAGESRTNLIFGL